LGISQLKKLDEFIRRRKEIVEMYNEAFEDMPEIETPVVKPYVKPAWHIYTVLLNGINRDEFFSKMRGRNIGVNLHYIPIYHFLYYRGHFNFNPKDFPATEEVFSKIVTLPLFPKMEDDEVSYVINTVKETINEIKKMRPAK
jgi:dTDP-4-amino-4,6-dideoxygalactose transaminase